MNIHNTNSESETNTVPYITTVHKGIQMAIEILTLLLIGIALIHCSTKVSEIGKHCLVIQKPRVAFLALVFHLIFFFYGASSILEAFKLIYP